MVVVVVVVVTDLHWARRWCGRSLWNQKPEVMLSHTHSFVQRPDHPSFGWVKNIVDG